MGFINKNLSEGEEIVVVGKVSKWVYMPMVYFFLGVSLLSLISSVRIFGFSLTQMLERDEFILSAIVFFGFATYFYLKNIFVEMAITNKRVVYKKGIIAQDTNELRLEKIEGVSIKRGILGTIFGYGTIIFSGVGDSMVSFINLDNALKIKIMVDDNLDKHKS